MTDITGKIEKLNMNNTGTKRDGSSYTNIKLKLADNEEIITISKTSPAGKYAEGLELKVGDVITVVKGGQWNSVQKIMKGTGFTKSSGKSFSGKSSYNSDGARSGMIVGKAIELAIARKEIDTDGLKIAAKEVLELTQFVEAQVKSTPKADVDPFKKTEDTVTADADFANTDEDF